MSDTLKIIFPAGHLGAHGGDDWLDLAMRVIAVGFGADGEWSEKYGTTFENDVFLMRPECWCDKEDGSCLYCMPGDHPEYDQRLRERFGTTNYQAHANRGYYDPPNFWFKPDDFRVSWYKYIGRSMATNGDTIPADMLNRVFASHPTGRTVADVVAELERRTEETAAQWSAMMDRLNEQFSRETP